MAAVSDWFTTAALVGTLDSSMERNSGESRRTTGRLGGSLCANAEVEKAMEGLLIWIWWANSDGEDNGLDGETAMPRERREK